ncbi:unnamed protein product [Owenia fusiformis]|uniref:Uncharacterized protein n=1 Tax=Owenia fusiformis TaxID=6347 RepID=A0A8S4NVJ2_OWEFU|nr:unnamed protein product [Owenia fusiformis]
MEILRKNRRGLITVAPANEANTVDNSYVNDEWLRDVEGASKKKECVFKNDLLEERNAENGLEEDTSKLKKKGIVEEEEEEEKEKEEEEAKLEEDTSALKKEEGVLTNVHVEVEEEVGNEIEEIMNDQNYGQLEIVGQSIENGQKENSLTSDGISPDKEGQALAKSPTLMSLVSLDLEEDWLESSFNNTPIIDQQDEEPACSCFPWACTMKDRFKKVRGFFSNIFQRKRK